MKARDNQKERLYRAERGIQSIKSEAGMPIDVIQEYVDQIVKSLWWKRYIGKAHRISISGTHGGGHAFVYSSEITLGVWARQTTVVLHEVAHVASYRRYGNHVANHGPEFAGVMLALVKKWYGKEPYEKLRLRYLRGDVQWVELKPIAPIAVHYTSLGELTS